MKKSSALIAMTLLTTSLLLGTVRAETAALKLSQIQQQWASAKYQQTGDQQEQTFAELVKTAQAAAKANPSDARYLIWEGIIRATYAGSVGGLDALDEVETAKDLFEQALKQDEKALDGSAYTSLGSLYYQVPGWPLGFGSDKKAREYLLKGLAVNPDGIDSNYFYGDFLLQQKEYTKAVAVLEKALLAAPRPGREDADAGRRQEIEQALGKARSKIKS
jgi:tetratricopeptide (TPR) repeat protein